MSNSAILTGKYFMHGDHAIAEGALASGCRFFAGYPITPSTEVAEHLARRLPEVDGVFIQMEDELASSAAVIGASAAGQRAMTATSGPGLSLMLEKSWTGSDDGDPLRLNRHPARISLDRSTDHGRAIRCDANAVGFAWRL